MSAQELITEHLDLWTGAVTKKSSSGRGSSGKVELTGIKKLRELILNLAVRGKLVPQNSEEPSAASLLADIETKKKELHQAKIVKKPTQPCQPRNDEAPWTLPSSWEWVMLPDIYYSISPSGKKLKSSETEEMGQFPVVDQGQSYISGYTNDESLVIKIPHPVIIFGDHTTARKYIDFNFVPGADGTKILCPILVNPRFFYLQLLGYNLESRGYARHFKVLNQNFFAVPALEEQHRIVQKVEELMGLCNRLEQQSSGRLKAHETLVDTLLGTLAQSENANELADNWARLAAHFDTLFTSEQSIDKLKQAILQLAVMGRLVEQDAGDESTNRVFDRVYSEDGNRRSRFQASRQITSESHLPLGWDYAVLPEVTEDKKYSLKRGPFGSALKKAFFRTSGFKVYEQQHAINNDFSRGDYYIDEEKFAELKAFEVKPGDLIISCSGTVGRVAEAPSWMEPGIINQALLKLSLDQRLLSNDYFRILFPAFFLETDTLQNLQGTAQKNMVSMDTLKKEAFPMPPIEEQHRIVQKIDELMALCDQLKERLNQAGETQCQLAEAVLEGALTA